ncbi:MAG TPA: hypothetical protein VNJ54_01570 [Plantibacter sp.]|nr:hypothetical protein [Plantibacter sp.]
MIRRGAQGDELLGGVCEVGAQLGLDILAVECGDQSVVLRHHLVRGQHIAQLHHEQAEFGEQASMGFEQPRTLGRRHDRMMQVRVRLLDRASIAAATLAGTPVPARRIRSRSRRAASTSIAVRYSMSARTSASLNARTRAPR